MSTRRTTVPAIPSAVIVAALLLAASLLLLSPRSAHAGDGDTPDPGELIVDVAMQSLGLVEGECFPWVRRVVYEATGNEMGFGYHEGYLAGGAEEVPLETVRTGDIIQIIDPDDAGPGASHAGMHTAIVVEPNGDGTMTAIDSNSQWDGVVRIREHYDPVANAERYSNLAVRAYRFSSMGTPIAPSLSQNDGGQTVDGGAATLTSGAVARIETTGSCLNLRETPGLNGNIVTCLANGSTVTVLAGETQADGHNWRQVETSSGATGWVSDNFLAPVDGSSGGNPTSSEPEPSAPSNAGQILSGAVPASGGVGLISWGGGSLESLRDAAASEGCGLLSVWVTRGGAMLGYIVNAPEFVNQTWLDQIPAELAQTPLLVVCAGDSGPSSPSSPGTSPSGSGSSGGTTGDGPPGPAGNE